MFEFSEKLVEACVAAKPAAFLPFKCSVKAQQFKLRGFRPDLLLSRESATDVILEIQLDALDRAHLYKALEYRDLYSAEYQGSTSEVKLLCESLPEKYEPLLTTHNVEVIRFKRDEFLRTALKACPRVLVDFVRSSDGEIRENQDKYSRREKRRGRFDFEPFSWSRFCSPIEVEQHLKAEFVHLGISAADLPRDYYRDVYHSLTTGYRDHFIEAIRAFYRPEDWDWEYVLRDSDGRRPIKKPGISIGCYVTSKGNFTVWWRGEQHFSNPRDCGWKYPPSDSTYGWQRPQNELLFVRSVDHLDPRPGLGRRFEHEGDWSALDSILVTWMAASYREICEIARAFYDVEVVSDIDLILSKKVRKDWRARQFAIGWKVVNAEEKERREDESTLADLEEEHAISVDDFIEAYRDGRKLAAQSKAAVPNSVLAEIARRGGKMTAREARNVLDILQRLRPDTLVTAGDGET